MKRLKNLICPNCKKPTAMQSSAYPEIAVCYCGGLDLKEVGKIKNGQIVYPLGSDLPLDKFNSIHFEFECMFYKPDVMSAGVIFINELANPSKAEEALKRGDIWVAKYDGEIDHEFSVIFMITHKEKRFTDYYLKDHKQIPSGSYNEIKDFLLRKKMAFYFD